MCVCDLYEWVTWSKNDCYLLAHSNLWRLQQKWVDLCKGSFRTQDYLHFSKKIMQIIFLKLPTLFYCIQMMNNCCLTGILPCLLLKKGFHLDMTIHFYRLINCPNIHIPPVRVLVFSWNLRFWWYNLLEKSFQNIFLKDKPREKPGLGKDWH